MKVIHYTNQKDFKLKRIKITNDGPRSILNKPDGGLWATPIDSKYGWEDWCSKSLTFRDVVNQNKVIMELDTSHFVIIDNVRDLNKLFWYKPFDDMIGFEKPDFEKTVKMGTDAIYLTEEGQHKTRLTHPKNLYGWDCECVLILNGRCISKIEEQK